MMLDEIAYKNKPPQPKEKILKTFLIGQTVMLTKSLNEHQNIKEINLFRDFMLELKTEMKNTVEHFKQMLSTHIQR